jgi:predicted nucleic acid-binding protein
LKLFFDSSVLVAVFYGDHPNHAESERAFLAAVRESSFCALASMAEVYNVLTGMPLRPRITGAEGIEILRQIGERLTCVALTESEYLATIETYSSKIVGGAIYDALIARCALKADADILLTWNARDFVRLGDDIAPRVKNPAECKFDQ